MALAWTEEVGMAVTEVRLLLLHRHSDGQHLH